MADAGPYVTKACLEKSDVTQCSAAAANSTEHALSCDKNEARVSDVSHSVSASKSETKAGVFMGVASHLLMNACHVAGLTKSRPNDCTMIAQSGSPRSATARTSTI